jgi:hypothetical protein
MLGGGSFTKFIGGLGFDWAPMNSPSMASVRT